VAYISTKGERDRIKLEVLSSVDSNSKPVSAGRESYRLGAVTVHVRYCSTGKGKYKFNINPNSLRATHELWICGDAKHWYLLPIRVLRQMYEHPRAYPDNHHPEIRVVSVDTQIHRVGFAAGSIALDLTPYFQAGMRS
jgi:hypothetical protein